MNTAIDSDDAHPELREHARLAMNRWRQLIEQIVRKAVARGEFADQIAPTAVATIIISVLEGALALARLEDDRMLLQQAQAHLNSYIDSLTVTTQPR